MIRLLIFGALAWIAYSLVKRWLRTVLPPSTAAQGPVSRQGQPMVEDPQCGTFIPTDTAISSTVAGKKIYFCSKECCDTYLKTH